MGNCGDMRKFTCGTKTQSICVHYKGFVPEYSKLNKEDCVTIEETTEDNYKLISWIKESIDLKDFDPSCLNIDEKEDSYNEDKTRYLVKDVLTALTQRMCELEDEVEDANDDTLELDFKCLTAPCGDPIRSLKDLLQTLINEICKLKNPL